MSGRPRFVFDTNVVVSALLFEQSTPGQAFHFALDAGDILVSAGTVTELNDVLSRPAFDRYVTSDEREVFLRALIRESTLVEVVEALKACRDPKDDKFLELAVNGSASCIVSGDEDLLLLHPFRSIPIFSPTEFLRTHKK